MVAAPTPNGVRGYSQDRDAQGRPVLVEEFSLHSPEEQSRLTRLCELLMGLEHPCLARFYGLEIVDGRVRARSEWVEESPTPGGHLKAVSHLAQGLDLLREGTDGQLPVDLASSVVAVRGGGFRLARYELSRWLGSQETRAQRQARCFQDLGRLALTLLRGRHPADAREIYALNLPFRMAWVFERALSGDPARCFGSFGEFTAMLDCEAAPPPLRPHKSPLPPVVRSSRRTSWSGWAWRTVVAGLTLMLLTVLFSALRPRPVLTLTEAAVFAAEGQRLTVYAATTGRPLASLDLGERVTGLAADRETLYAGFPDSRRVGRLNLTTGEWLADIPVGPGAGSLHLDPTGKWLAVEFPTARLVSFWRLGPKIRAAGSLGVHTTPVAMAFLEGWLALGCAHGDVSVCTLNPLRVEGRLNGGARCLAVSAGGNSLYLAQGLATIKVVELATQRTQSILDTGEAGLVSFAVASTTGNLWCLHENGRVVELNPHGGERVGSLEIPGRPVDTVTDTQRQLWWIASSNPPGLTALSLKTGRIVIHAATDGVASDLAFWRGP